MKGCLANVEKLTRQCRKLLWVMVDFTVAWLNPQGVSAWWKETTQTRIRSFSFLVVESLWTSIKQSQTLTTHNANRHCRVPFYTSVGQPLSKQLFNTALVISRCQHIRWHVAETCRGQFQLQHVHTPNAEGTCQRFPRVNFTKLNFTRLAAQRKCFIPLNGWARIRML